MAKKVIIRRAEWNTDVAKLERLVKDNYKEILKEHFEDLEIAAEWINDTATALVPYDFSKKNKTFHLQDSINVRVSRNPRYPGIIATASAKHKGFDYALIQEENEEFQHIRYERMTDKGEPVAVDSGRIAHYLGGPFASSISALFEDLGYDLDLPEDLQHAMEYFEENGGGY